MKKRNIIFIVIGGVLLISLWILGYTAMGKYETTQKMKAIYRDTVEYVNADPQFASEYGTPVTISEYSKGCVEYLEPRRCVVVCTVTVDSGKVYCLKIQYDFSTEREFSYIEIQELNT